MKSSKMSHKKINARRKRLARIIEFRGMGSRPVVISQPEKKGGVIVFQSELDYLLRCILDYPDIETGGQLFGYWTEDGVPVVMYAIGPGPRANHQTAFFNQDVNYLLTVGKLLKERFGLHHIGEWHSHHRLGLAKPSSHDAHTMNSTIREKGLGRFLLCIGNLNGYTPTVGAFLCDGEHCSQVEWETIAPASPMRSLIDRDFERVLVHPRATLQRREDSTGRGNLPEYAPGYWLRDKENRVILNDIINYVKDNCGFPNPEVRVLLNEKGEVILRIEYFGVTQQEILFPIRFPWVAPKIKVRRSNCLELILPNNSWSPVKGISAAFCQYYKDLV